MKLQRYKELPDVCELLAQGVEVVADLDQDPFIMKTCGKYVPCLVTHGTLYGLKVGRMLLEEELLEVQGIPMFPDSLAFAGLPHPLIPIQSMNVSPAMVKRFAGNTFHQACVGNFMAFIFASATRNDLP